MRYETPRHAKVAEYLEALRFELRAKGGFEAELRRALEAKAEMRGIIEAKERTREEIS